MRGREDAVLHRNVLRHGFPRLRRLHLVVGDHDGKLPVRVNREGDRMKAPVGRKGRREASQYAGGRVVGVALDEQFVQADAAVEVYRPAELRPQRGRGAQGIFQSVGQQGA